MLQKDNMEFYSELPVNEIRLSRLFSRPHLFNDLPDDWNVIITDIEGSTEAISKGHHHDINMIATESIVAVLNIIYKNGIDIPFFFGGDGATFILPSNMLSQALQILRTLSENVLDNFKLKLRVGNVTVAEIREKGFSLMIAKSRTTSLLSIPVILGDGINYAEKKVKGADYQLKSLLKPNPEIDLQGMQCRWDHIDAPQNRDEVISLVVMAKSEVHQPDSFSKVISFLDEIFGNVESRKAVSTSKLKLLTNFSRIKKQMQSQMKEHILLNTTLEWFKTLIGRFYFDSKRGKQYLSDLVQLTDDLVLDGKINTVISGTREQRLLLEAKLQKMEDEQLILFGLSVSDAAVISCYVRDMYLKHIHFVDGIDGGYTKAGSMLKEKLRRVSRI